jgi:hypothetical protein
MRLDGPIPHLLLMRRCALLVVSPLHCLVVLLLWLGVVLHAKLFSHQRGPAVPHLAISHRWGPAAPLAISQVRCRRSRG